MKSIRIWCVALAAVLGGSVVAHARSMDTASSAGPYVSETQESGQASETSGTSDIASVDQPPTTNTIDPGLYFRRELPLLAIKTDLLYTATTFTLNLSGEIGLGKRFTFEFSGSNNRWNRKGDEESNRKFVHWTLRPEVRYWLCERFNGHFFGINATYWQYNVSGRNVLWMFDEQYRYNGNAWGGGITYGYNLMLAKKWSIEFTAGIGFAVMNHERFDCRICGDVIGKERKVYFGPTRASVSLVFLIK